jgi:uncharacterized membrane protein
MKDMSAVYLTLVYLHLATILPAFFIGGFMLAKPKGTPRHRWLGKLYMVLMLLTGVITLLMPARVGPQVLNHFGVIHIFSVIVLIAVPLAYFAARNHQHKRHALNMIATYVGGILIAGAFAFMPGRLLHHWLFQ